MHVPTASGVSDSTLIQIVDRALATAALKSGPWLACHLGCTQCCVGVFAINQLDAARLRQGMAELQSSDPQRAKALQMRVAKAIDQLSPHFPGDPSTGILAKDAQAEIAFESFADDEVCPVLDPATGACDLYSSRPMTCRVFGPPVRSQDGLADGLGVCELCYHCASPEEIAACEMVPDPEQLESQLLTELEEKTGAQGETIVAFALAR